MARFDDLRAAHKAWREAVARYESRFEHALRSGGCYDSSKGMEELDEIERLFSALKREARGLLERSGRQAAWPERFARSSDVRHDSRPARRE